MNNFITTIELQSGQSADYEILHREMMKRLFHRHVVASDNIPFLLPTFSYFSCGNLSAVEVRNLAGEAAKATGKPHIVLTVAVVAEQVAWSLNRLLPPLPPIGVASAPKITDLTPEEDLFTKIQDTMDKIKPLAETTAKMSSDFGKMLIKGCTTLNAGALIALPTFYKALATGSAPTPRNLEVALLLFAVGLVAGAFAGWIAFVFTSQASRMLVRSLQLPMLKTQQAMHPETMDRAQRKRLTKAEADARRVEPTSTIGLWFLSVACAVSIGCLVAGAIYGGTATLSIAKV